MSKNNIFIKKSCLPVFIEVEVKKKLNIYRFA